MAKRVVEILCLEKFNPILAEEVPNADKNLPEKIEELIDNSDGVIAIASKDEKLDGKDEWTTSNWIHQEISYAKAKKKPILIFYEKNLSTKEKIGFQEGLEYLEFDRNNLDEFIINSIKYIREFHNRICEFKFQQNDNI